MSAHPGELSPREKPKGRVAGLRRSLAVLAVVVAAGLGAGFAIGSLLKGSGSGHRSPPARAPGVSTARESIPVVPVLHAIVTLPSLRGRLRSSPAVASGTTGSSAPSASPSAVTSAPASNSTPAPSVSPTPSSASPASKQTAPSHRGGGEVHHESGGGA
jgi:hypothetical protein